MEMNSCRECPEYPLGFEICACKMLKIVKITVPGWIAFEALIFFYTRFKNNPIILDVEAEFFPD